MVHLDHIHSSDLSDKEDIVANKDLCRRANWMLSIFIGCDPLTKTKLFQSFCLSLYGSVLWKVEGNYTYNLVASAPMPSYILWEVCAVFTTLLSIAA